MILDRVQEVRRRQRDSEEPASVCADTTVQRGMRWHFGIGHGFRQKIMTTAACMCHTTVSRSGTVGAARRVTSTTAVVTSPGRVTSKIWS